MVALPTVVSVLVALVITPALLRGLRASGHVRQNFAGRDVVFPLGLAVPIAVFGGLAVVAPLDRLVDDSILRGSSFAAVLILVIGIALLGMIDDIFGTPVDQSAPRGWRGHASAVARGHLSTGVIKAAGALGLAAAVAGYITENQAEYIVAVPLIILTTNLFNLLDLRPGRALKVFFVAIVTLGLATWKIEPLWTLGMFVGPLAVLSFYDLRERAMLGDTGSNVVGAVVGVWMVLALPLTAQLVALGAVISFTIFAEFRSISELIDRSPLLSFLDSIGRPPDARPKTGT